MTADEAMAYYATRAKHAGLNGDEAAREHWEERITIISDQREAVRRRAEFDALKGGPDHSGISAAEHAHIHSDACVDALGPSLRHG